MESLRQIGLWGGARRTVQRTRHALGGYRRNVAGATAMEFGMIAPVFLFLVFTIIETSVYYYKQSHLKYVLSQAGRGLQTGEIQKSDTPKDDFDAVVCDTAEIVFDCSKVHLDVRSFATVADVTFPDPAFDENGKPTNFVFQPGGTSQITAMRASATHKFITPFLTDILQPDGKPVILVGFSIFKNEPF
ncbi:TadE/TadG family type IV pilus assembly protein [Oricola thermophila]|uniref:Pilus assembly protein n=1 Tax=Oricola thermophila TaxID=2742145 RepID=A0A6N1VE65_9HYPH|nr:TadE/TadG family type IV pilus assembly protein [Oricola thermophila]QKV19216.1 pilus assembly protein [Oricola thermophila]